MNINSRKAFDLPSNAVILRPYQGRDRAAVFHLLSFLPNLYPNGHDWLEHRLAGVLKGQARCTLAVAKGVPIGITIETPKSHRRLKLSTIFIHPLFRGIGVGSSLMSQCYENWRQNDLAEVWVTTDVKRASIILPLFSRFSFEPNSIEYNRYGSDRHELILVWRNR